MRLSPNAPTAALKPQPCRSSVATSQSRPDEILVYAQPAVIGCLKHVTRQCFMSNTSMWLGMWLRVEGQTRAGLTHFSEM